MSNEILPEAREAEDIFSAVGGFIDNLKRENAELRAKLAEAERENQWFKAVFDKGLCSDSIVASCNCRTKTNEVKHHAVGCKYRLIMERDAAIARAEAAERERDKAVQQFANLGPDSVYMKLVSERDELRRQLDAAVTALERVNKHVQNEHPDDVDRGRCPHCLALANARATLAAIKGDK